MNLTEKILKEHLISGELIPGNEIAIKIDQTLTQDSTGTMAYLEFEAMGLDKVKTELSVAYIDHNMLQQSYENADDHAFIQSAAGKFGVICSKPGNGICHQVHLERFARPGKTLLGSDSHTPTCGAMGMLAIGAGGMDVAVAMGGGAYYFKMPEIYNIKLTGSLKPWVSAKDVILYILKLLSVKGGVGKIFEYSGDGVKTLTIPERATIANMGAELGATASIFPSDENTLEFLKSQNRESEFVLLNADLDAKYSGSIEINLSNICPMAAAPHSPDNVKFVESLSYVKVDQVAIGSCTNSSYKDLMKAAEILKGRQVHPDVSLVIAPGSKAVLSALCDSGALKIFLDAGARILECGCGPCIGMGQAPRSGAVSVRTFNRNFEGRCGTQSAGVYIVSPETAAITAIKGYITDPRILGEEPFIPMPEYFEVSDSLMIYPDGKQRDLIKGPNIKSLPVSSPILGDMDGKVLLKVGDNITTDHIVPSHAALLPLRSNIPELSKHCFENIDKEFADRAKASNGGFIIGGSNYGQGSSREHAALVPLYLGIKGVIAKSFARIHRSNLINSGILPMTFIDEKDYDDVDLNDRLIIEGLEIQIINGDILNIHNIDKKKSFKVELKLTSREKAIILAGGLLNYTREQRTTNNGY